MVDRVTLSETPDPATVEAQRQHVEQMAAKADAGVTSVKATGKEGDQVALQSQQASASEPPKRERPADIPEKFWDAEKGEVNVAALLKAQQDAEAALRQYQQNQKKPDETPAGDGNPPSQESVVDAASKEFAEKGELSPETYEQLAKVGLSKDVVDSYIAGQRAIMAQLQSAAFGEFGGSKENYDKACRWAANNLSEEEIAALDAQLTSTNPAIVREGAKALAAKYAAEADITPSVTVGGTGNVPATGDYFKSKSEMKAAMSDPRYKTDINFQKEVMMKIDRAEKAGINLFV